MDVASEAYGDFSLKLRGAFGVLDVASETYGELRRYAQAAFGVLDVASESYGEFPVRIKIQPVLMRIKIQPRSNPVPIPFNRWGPKRATQPRSTPIRGACRIYKPVELPGDEVGEGEDR